MAVPYERASKKNFNFGLGFLLINSREIMNISFIPIKTKKILPPQEDIFPILAKELEGKIRENDVLLITSKILGIHQGNCLPIEGTDKDELIKKESDQYISRDLCPNKNAILTIKDNTLIPSAGIDESNSNGYFVMYPQNTQKLLAEIREFLCQKFSIKNLGIIATDSHSIPLRWGVMGVSIGFSGLKPFIEKAGTPDIFGRKLQFTRVNVVDSLASLGVVIMGEANEQTPLLIIRGANFAEFTNQDFYDDFIIAREDDMFAPILSVFDGQRPSGKGRKEV